MTGLVEGAEATFLIDLSDQVRRGWSVVHTRGWVQCAPPGARLPDSGWKAHVSAAPGEFEAVVGVLRDVAVRHGLVFKFLPTSTDALNNVSKGTLRSVSGKLGCVYAVDAETLGSVVEALRIGLKGFDGPDILTDLRCGPEPVFIRYGAFAETWCFHEGERRLGLHDPEGRVVVDVGRAKWGLPSWVGLPPWAEPYVQQRRDRMTNLPCSLRRALHFSNAGGVYEGEMRGTGEVVLVKEGRPLTGFDSDGRDAAERLASEHAVLKSLQGTALVPRDLGFHRGSRHVYLLRELLQGETAVERYATAWPWHHSADPSAVERVRHLTWAAELLESTRQLLSTVHERDLLVHDLHPGNLFLTDDGVKLFDLETLTSADRSGPPPVIVPDYLAPEGTRGLDRDRFAFRVLAHALLSPSVGGWNTPGRRPWIRRWIADHFGDRAVQQIDTRAPFGDFDPVAPGRPMDQVVRQAHSRAVSGTQYTHDPEDMSLGRGLAGVVMADALHPDGHPPEGALATLQGALATLAATDPSLGTGAAGLVLALTVAGHEPDLDDWSRRTRKLIRHRSVEPHLWHGLAGIAVAAAVARQTIGWQGADELLADLHPQLSSIVPGGTGGRGLLLGDAGLALTWSILDRCGVPGSADRARSFLEAPGVGPEGLRGGLEGVGGWFLAVGQAPEQVWAELAPAAEQIMHCGLRHRDGGLAWGLGGTLIGLGALEGRRTRSASGAWCLWSAHAPAWLVGEAPAIFDVHSSRPDDGLQFGTAAYVLADALRGGRGMRHAT